MSVPFGVAVTVVLAAGLAAVVLVALRDYAAPSRWWQLLPSLAPIALVSGAVLAIASGGN